MNLSPFDRADELNSCNREIDDAAGGATALALHLRQTGRGCTVRKSR